MTATATSGGGGQRDGRDGQDVGLVLVRVD